MTAYIAASIILTRWRTQLRRQMNERDAVTRGIHTDCLLNYETVKYFGGEQHEGERYQDAIRQHQSVGYKVLVSLSQHVELGAKRYHHLRPFGRFHACSPPCDPRTVSATPICSLHHLSCAVIWLP